MPVEYKGTVYERKEDFSPPEVSLSDVGMEFANRLRTVKPSEEDIKLAGQDFGEDLPQDVLEELARQRAAAAPLLERFHIIAEATPSLAMARATNDKAINEITDIVTAMDLSNLDDDADFEPEFTCPRCAHRWSGASNYRTGYGNKVYVPKGRVSPKTGRLLNDRYGPPVKTVPHFKYGRNWRGAGADKLPRGYGNKPIGVPLVFNGWHKRFKGKG